jgi:3-hydroxybutyryl-CoA dehydratase
VSGIRRKTIAGLKVGDSFSITRTFAEEDVLRFADVTRDYNPVHFDERFSGTKNFRARICHGLLVGSMISEIGGQIGWLASEMKFQFKKPVYIGETISCSLTITRVDPKGRAEAVAVFRNQESAIVLEASLKGILPGPREVEVMTAMIAEGDPTNKLG